MSKGGDDRKMKELSFFRLTEGDVVVDLGAGRGGSTLFFSRQVGLKGRVIAVEPVVENYVLLTQALTKNNILNVIPVLAGIDTKSKPAYIWLSNNWQSHSYVRKSERTRLVPTLRWIDLMLSLNIGYVNLLHCDIEGLEYPVLNDMEHIYPEKLMVEEHTRHTDDPAGNLRKLTSLIESKGYEYWVHEGLYLYGSRVLSDLRRAFLRWLKKEAQGINGSVLNVGGGRDWYHYRRFFPQCFDYKVLDKQAHAEVAIVNDIADMRGVNSLSFDCVVCSFVTDSLINSLTKALGEIHRVLRVDGTLLINFVCEGYQLPLAYRYTESEAYKYVTRLFKVESAEDYFEKGRLVCIFMRCKKKAS